MAARRLVGGHDDGQETSSALAAMGLVAETKLGDADVEIHESNAKSVEVFSAMMTQWNAGPAGVIGLRYESIPPLLAMARVPRADWAQLFADLRVMEQAALEAIRGK